MWSGNKNGEGLTEDPDDIRYIHWRKQRKEENLTVGNKTCGSFQGGLKDRLARSCNINQEKFQPNDGFQMAFSFSWSFRQQL